MCSREPCVRESGRRDCEDRGVDIPVCGFVPYMFEDAEGKVLERAG